MVLWQYAMRCLDLKFPQKYNVIVIGMGNMHVNAILFHSITVYSDMKLIVKLADRNPEN